MYKRGIVKRESTVERNTHSEACSVEKVHRFVKLQKHMKTGIQNLISCAFFLIGSTDCSFFLLKV